MASNTNFHMDNKGVHDHIVDVIGETVVVTAAPANLTDSTGGAVTSTLASGITDTVAKNAIASLNKHINDIVAALKTAGVLD